jgi:hypothetical protein
MALFLQRLRRGEASAASAAPAPGATMTTAHTPNYTPAAANPAEVALPEGWEVAEYAGKGGRPAFAVYAGGRRMASGMPSLQSAARWARLLAAATPAR